MNLLRDILIIGGGIIGLSLAIELKLRGATVTLLSRDFNQAAAHAAAGMLAPQAEAIPPSPMLDLCLQSRDLYPAWIDKLEVMTGLTAGYWPCGILAPVYEQEKGDFPASAHWLDAAAIHQHQAGLSQEVIGGWWYPLDAQVDNRALFRVLLAAAQELKIDIREGTVKEVIDKNGKILSVQTSLGELQSGHYVLAAGAWSSELFPIPVYPKKGQMLSIRVPTALTKNLPLQRVLFGTESYIVPRRDGKIVLGATSENVGFMPGNTAAGVQALLQAAIRLYPGLRDYEIQEFWWGFRPATPDELPILGASEWENLTFATGHYRNGILLAPVTAEIIANLLEKQQESPLLAHFHYSRFEASITA